MLRWIGFSRVSMQRLGSLVAVTAAASHSRPTSLEGMGESLMRLLSQRVQLQPEDAYVIDYVHDQRLWERYPKLHEIPRGETSAPDATVEAQDRWLADPTLPSSTGAVTAEVVHEPPQLASAIQLVRAKNFTCTDRGRVLTALLRDQVEVLNDGARSPNPFNIPLGAGAVLLYALLDADIDFMRAVYGVALEDINEDASFTRATFSAWLPPALITLSSGWAKKARTGPDHKQLQRLRDLHDLISRPRQSGPKWGGGRPPEQTSTVRIEPYVDLGLISKKKRSTYSYYLTPGQRGFFASLVGAVEPQAFIDDTLFESYLRARGHQSPEAVDGAEIWVRIASAYRELRSDLGYASFREVVLLAVARLMGEGTGRFFEMSAGIERLQAERKNSPRSVRFGVARGGGLTYMKLVDEAKAARDA